MKKSIRTGFSFGLTSGIITTLGLMIGLNSATNSKLVVIGGIITIAIADSLSDSLGIHISEESQGTKTKQVWESTIATFLSKLIFALTFIIPVLLLTLTTAIIISIIWGLLLISILSFYIAEKRNVSPWKIVAEHVLIAVVVIIATHYVGKFVGGRFV